MVDARPLRKATFRRQIAEWLIGGGALLTIGAAVADWFQDGARNTASLRIETCKRAYEAITDDSYNKSLSDPQIRQFNMRQCRERMQMSD